MTQYESYLADHLRLREEIRKSECTQGRHNWQHCYNFAQCTRCGETMGIPTTTELNQQ